MINLVLAQVDIGHSELNPPVFTSFGELVAVLLPNIYILAGIILFLLLIAGGFGIILSAGKGLKEGVAKGSKMVTAAVIGFLIVLGSYWLIQIISKITGLNILSSPF